MTPTTVTRAARAKQTKAPTRAPAMSGARSAGHRAKLSEPRTSRRVSGPLSGAPARRVSGPARPIPRHRTGAPRTAAPRTGSALGAHALEFVKTLPDRQLLDRVVRGRAWIPLLGVLLAGIVAMQVEVLKLGAGLGRSIERSAQLQSRNDQLRASVATLADDRRIESLAAGMGMVMPAPDAINFLRLGSAGYVQRAVANIHQPNASGFTASLPASNPATSGGTAATIAVPSAAGPSATAAAPASAVSSGTSSSGAPSSSTGG